MWSIGIVFFLVIFVFGVYLGSFLINVISKYLGWYGYWFWIDNVISFGYMDYYFWFLVVFSGINFVVYFYCVYVYEYKVELKSIMREMLV